MRRIQAAVGGGGLSIKKNEAMSLYQRALHLAARQVIVKEQVEPETAQQRFEICMTCENRDAKNNKCKLCGCFLYLKCGAKTNWNALKMRNEITHCPAGKWGDVETANIYRQMDGKDSLTNN